MTPKTTSTRSIVLAVFVLTACPHGASCAESVTAFFESIRTRYQLPAVGVAVIKDARLISVDVVGFRKQGSNVKATATDKFHLGSCGKAMTATLVAKLIEEGELSWTTAIEDMFPEINAFGDSPYKNVTIEQLLTHRSGLPRKNWPPGTTFMDMHRVTGFPMQKRRKYVNRILQRPPSSKPGERYEYANANYAIAGAMAEQAMGKSWEELMKHFIFMPLKMTSPGFGAMGQPGAIEQPWQHVLKDGKLNSIEPGPLSDNPDVIGPAGIIHCTLRDWAIFVIDHLKGVRGQGKLLAVKTYKKLHTAPKGQKYAMGWITRKRQWGGGTVLMHAGSNTMNYAVVWAAPQKGFAVLVVTNVGGTNVSKGCDEIAWNRIQHWQ